MRIEYDGSSLLKHYTEKDNYYIVENSDLLTLNLDDKNELNQANIIHLFMLLNGWSKNDALVFTVLAENPGRFVGWRSVYNFILEKKNLSFTTNTCRNALDNLRDNGLIYTNANGFYTVAGLYKFLTRPYKGIFIKLPFNNSNNE